MKKQLIIFSLLISLVSCNYNNSTTSSYYENYQHSEEHVEYFSYRLLSDDTYMIDGIMKNFDNDYVYIPSFYMGKKVTKLSESLFINYKGIKKVYLPNTLQEIPSLIFLNSSIEYVRVPMHLKYNDYNIIKKEYFGGEYELYSEYKDLYLKSKYYNFEEEKVNIYENCAYIGSYDNPYELVISLLDVNSEIVKLHKDVKYLLPDFKKQLFNVKSIIIDNSKKFEDKDGVLYSKDFKELECFPGGKKVEKLDLTEVSKINNYAFNSVEIETIELSKKIKSISDYAFFDCKINNLLIENNDCFVYSDDILYDKNQKEIILYTGEEEIIKIIDSVEIIKPFAFARRDLLNEVDLNNVKMVMEGAFYFSRNIEKIKMDNVLEIGPTAFYSLNVCDLDLSNVVTIGKSAFSNCNNLKKVVLSKKLMHIPEGCFQYCYQLEEILIPENIKSIGCFAFAHCNFKEITLPYGIENVGPFAFNSILEKINTSENFYGLSYLNYLNNNVEVNSIKTNEHIIYNGQFYGSLMEHYVIKDGLHRIDSYSFARTLNAEYIIIPESVYSIGQYAFEGSNALIFFESNSLPKDLDENWNFSNCKYYLGYEWEYINGIPKVK